MTEGGLPSTISFCSVVHFERLASTVDGRVPTCKEDGVTCTYFDTKYYKHVIGEHPSYHSLVSVCVHVLYKHLSGDTACKEVTCPSHNMHV